MAVVVGEGPMTQRKEQEIPVSNQRGKVWGENGNSNYFPSKLSFDFQKEGIH